VRKAKKWLPTTPAYDASESAQTKSIDVHALLRKKMHTRTCPCYAPTLLGTCRWCFRATITTDRKTLSRTTTGAYTQRMNAVRRTLVANHACTNGYDTTAHAQPQSKRPLETLLRSDTEAHQHAMTDSKLSQP
jgi:hypothetical protein